jgi:hypothetical protein
MASRTTWNFSARTFKSKLGGNFVVAVSCGDKCLWDFWMEEIVSDIKIVVIEVDKETKLQRLTKRHAGSTGDITAEARAKLEKQFEVLNTLAEPVDKNEPDTFTLRKTPFQMMLQTPFYKLLTSQMPKFINDQMLCRL